MKLFKLVPVLLCILMISCQKDAETPITPIDPVETPDKLKKVSLWLDGKDTSATPDEVDTIYYNAKNVIEKVVTVQTGRSIKISTYQVFYNTTGSISGIQSSGTSDGENDQFFEADYQFIYNAAAKLDSVKIHWVYFQSNTFITFKYDTNGDLSDAYLWGHNTSNHCM